MSASIPDVGAVLRALPELWRRAADALERDEADDAARALRAVADETERAVAAARPMAPSPPMLPANVMPLLTTAQAAAYLGISERHLQDRADIPRLDVGPPRGARPLWRYRLSDLEAFAARRVVGAYEPAA